MKNPTKEVLQQRFCHLINSAGLLLHFLFFFLGLWALLFVLGAAMVLASTSDALLAARMTRLMLYFEPTSVLVKVLFLGSLSLALWQWINSINQKGTS